MQTIDFADILSTELQLAHTGYLTHALSNYGMRGHMMLFNDICYRFEFSTMSHFSRYVQKNLWMKPSDFRQ